MDVRPATVADAPAIATVHVRSWQETYAGLVPQPYLDGLSVEDRTEAWRKQLAGTGSPDVLVAVDDKNVVAFIVVSASGDDDADSATGEVQAIYARRRIWGRGVGRLLMTHGLQLLANAGFQAVTLWVLETNDHARRFYEAGGWYCDGASKGAEIGGTPVTEVRHRRSLP